MPGRNYTVSVQAVSRDTQSKEEFIYLVTKPSAPIIEDLKPMVFMILIFMFKVAYFINRLFF